MFRLRICLKGCLREKNCFVSKDQTESSFRQAFKDVGFSSKYFEDSFHCHVQNFNNIFYNIKDLVRETNQPVTYLKSILNEVCNYNVKNPHKNMWELKPEYRHYKSNSDDEAKKKEDEGSSDDD